MDEGQQGVPPGQGGSVKWPMVLVVVVLAVGVIGTIIEPDIGRPEYWRARYGPAVEHQQQKSMAPAPKLRKGKPVRIKGKLMPTYIATGAGEANANGTFVPSGADFVNENGWVMWQDGDWFIAATKVNPAPAGMAYNCATITGTWTTLPGFTEPAPTLSEATTLPDWPWDWWWDGPYFGASSPFAPTPLVIGGVTYLAIAANAEGSSRYAIDLFNVSTKAFTRATATNPLFPSGGYDAYQTGALFDAGTGSHADLISGAWLDGATYKFTCRRFSVVSGGAATQTATQTVTLDYQDVTRFVEASVGSFRFVQVGGGNVTFCSYTAGAADYTRGTPVALPALPAGYSDVYCAADSANPLDQVLHLRAGTYYWLRHARRDSDGLERIFAYTVSDGTCVALEDTLSLGSTIPDYLQTWGDDPVRGYAVGDVGSGEPDTASSVRSLRWTPGSNGQSHFTFAEDPAGRRWFVTVGGVLYVAGWTDAEYEHRFYVIDTTPVPNVLEPYDGLARAMGDGTLVSYTPVELDPNGEGLARAIGGGELRSYTPVSLDPGGEGIARAMGDGDLMGATHLPPPGGTAVGIARAVGSAVLIGSHPGNPDEGPGAYGELVLTPGVWPGVARREALPTWYDRMSNRRYGGALPSGVRPQWWTPIDTTNTLAPYVQFWSWMREDPDDSNQLHDASGNGNHGTLYAANDLYACVVADAPEGYNGVYEPVREATDSFYLGYRSEDGQGELWPGTDRTTWVLRATGGADIEETDNSLWLPDDGSSQPWGRQWPSITVTQGDLFASKWDTQGLSAGGELDQRAEVALPDGLAAFTYVLDVTPWTRPNIDIAPDDFCIMDLRWQGMGGQDSFLLVHWPYPEYLEQIEVRYYWYEAATGSWHLTNAHLGEAICDFGVRQRLVVVGEAGSMVTIYLNGTALTCAPGDEFSLMDLSAKTLEWRFFGLKSAEWSVLTESDPLAGVVHEIGLLTGYAATADDVASNPLLALAYGGRGAPVAMTDRA